MSRKKVSISKLNLGILGNRICYTRIINDLTQEDFAEKAGLKKGSISKYESGGYYPSYKTLINIINEFNVDPEWLMIGRGEPPIKKPLNYVLREIQAEYKPSDQSGLEKAIVLLTEIFRSNDDGLIDAITSNLEQFARVENLQDELERREKDNGPIDGIERRFGGNRRKTVPKE